MKSARLDQLPDEMRKRLKDARMARGWSQRALGQQIGLPQAHISAIETGKVVPQFDTLLDLARSLGFDLLMVPAALLPAVRGLIRDFEAQAPAGEADATETPLYADEPDEDAPGTGRR